MPVAVRGATVAVATAWVLIALIPREAVPIAPEPPPAEITTLGTEV